MSVDLREKNAVLGLIQYFSDFWIVLDVGSNKSEWSDVLMKYRDSSTKAGQYHVWFFEPNELLLNYTKVKHDYNQNITYCNLACYKESGKFLPFYYFTDYHNGLSSIYDNPRWRRELGDKIKEKQIETISLDDYCQENKIDKIDIVKIDVEGAECDVLRGMVEILQNKKVQFIQIEYSEHWKLNNYKLIDVLSFFKQFGYNGYSWNGEEFVRLNREMFVEDYHAENFIFTWNTKIEKYWYTQPTWNQQFIYNTEFLKKRVNFALEIGAFEGLTSNYICDHLLKEGGRLICVDPLEDQYLTENLSEEDEEMNESLPYFANQYERFINNTKNKPVELQRMTSEKAFPTVLKDYLFDFIYIDGDHREREVYKDGVSSLDQLRRGGYILFDDYGWREDTKTGIDRFLADVNEHIEVISKGYQVLIRKK